MKKHQKVLCVVAFGISAGMASAAQVLSADELRQAVSGKVVGDGQHWTYHLKKDGSLEGAEMRRPVTGRWAVKGNRLCLSVPAEAPANCSQVGHAGKSLVLRDNGMDISDLRVAPYHSSKQWE